MIVDKFTAVQTIAENFCAQAEKTKNGSDFVMGLMKIEEFAKFISRPENKEFYPNFRVTCLDLTNRMEQLKLRLSIHDSPQMLWDRQIEELKVKLAEDPKILQPESDSASLAPENRRRRCKSDIIAVATAAIIVCVFLVNKSI